MTAIYILAALALGYFLGHGRGFERGYTEAVEAQREPGTQRERVA